jgi:pimeloyl-ACP methyl ester carboxylesterase
VYACLTPLQVIEDTASIVRHVRQQWRLPASVPAVVVGGSYGGMIAAYHRVVAPQVFHAAIASSAPIHYLGKQRGHCMLPSIVSLSQPSCLNAVLASTQS